MTPSVVALADPAAMCCARLSPLTTRRPVPRHPAARRWNDDWDRLVASAAATAALQRWSADTRLRARNLPELLVAAGAGAPTPAATADAVLGALVTLAPADELAGRVVVQRVLPALVSIARRRSHTEHQAISSLLDELVPTAWTVIVTYPLRRRPAKFAANIVRDTEYLTFVRPRRLRRVTEHLQSDDLIEERAPLCGLDGRCAGDAGNASEVVGRLLETARRRGLPAGDITLLRDLFVELRPVPAVAAQHALTERAVRYRRRAAIARLAEAVA